MAKQASTHTHTQKHPANKHGKSKSLSPGMRDIQFSQQVAAKPGVKVHVIKQIKRGQADSSVHCTDRPGGSTVRHASNTGKKHWSDGSSNKVNDERTSGNKILLRRRWVITAMGTVCPLQVNVLRTASVHRCTPYTAEMQSENALESFKNNNRDTNVSHRHNSH